MMTKEYLTLLELWPTSSFVKSVTIALTVLKKHGGF